MRRGRKALIAVAVVTAVGGGGVAATALTAPDKKSAAQDTAVPSATAEVTRGDLSTGVQQSGTVGYGDERKLNAGASGLLTWRAKDGSVVERDGKLYEIDGRPVRLMYGDRPMYRTLKDGDKGADVTQLEKNLQALGYSGFTPDDEYTDLTAQAVKRWQKDHGLKETGTIGPDQIAFAPGAVRVTPSEAAVGDPLAPGTAALKTTSADRVTQFDIDTAKADLAKAGSKVSVTLPDGSTVKGTVSATSTVAPKEGDQDKTAKTRVTVAFEHPDEVKALDRAPVTVTLTGETRKDVLSVPVNALLVLPGGGFGVQVVENGTARDVAVKLGLFGQGRVEVTGTGLDAGTKVGVPGA